MIAALAVVVALLAAPAAPAAAVDLMKYMEETRVLTERGEYEQALERHLWFHDHALDQGPAMYGVRLSFALSSWKELGDVYPPALGALVKVRDRKARSVIEKPGRMELFHDVGSINGVLGEGERTIALFEAVETKDPEAAGQLWIVAKDVVIAAKRWDVAARHVKDPVEGFDRVHAMHLLTSGTTWGGPR